MSLGCNKCVLFSLYHLTSFPSRILTENLHCVNVDRTSEVLWASFNASCCNQCRSSVIWHQHALASHCLYLWRFARFRETLPSIEHLKFYKHPLMPLVATDANLVSFHISMRWFLTVFTCKDLHVLVTPILFSTAPGGNSFMNRFW